MFNSKPYISSEQLLVGDGNGLQITYTRSAILDTFTHEPLLLNHVPHITKNLLSISKSLTNNNVVVEFVDNICYIKARNTWIILLKRIAQKGLYQVQAASNDSGATHHITSTLDLLSEVSPSPHTSVTLPNGNKVQIDSIGSTNFGSDFSLSNVFHVPSFCVNLLSVSKMTKSLNCSITFFC